MSEEEKNDQTKDQIKDQQTEEQPKEESAQKEWDKDRQQKDQLEATVRKMSERLSEAEEEKATLIEKLEKIEQAITQQQENAKTDLEPVDDALVDPKVARNLQKLAEQHKELAEAFKQQQQKIARYEQERQEYQQRQEQNARTEEILKPLDEEYGAKYRTAALKLAQELIDEGKQQPPPAHLAYRYMENCYKAVKAKDEAAQVKSIPTDSGFGGVPFDASKIKSGSREDVLADIRKKGLTGLGKQGPVGHT